MYFWYLCGFWLYVFLTCLCFWIYASIFVGDLRVHLHITVILVLRKTFWYDKCEKLARIIFKFSSFLWFLLRLVIKTLWNYVNIKEKHQIKQNIMSEKLPKTKLRNTQITVNTTLVILLRFTFFIIKTKLMTSPAITSAQKI